MGLDSIEILIKVEDSFGIKIPDEEAEQILTVSDFHDTVWRHLSSKQSDKCQSQLLFYRLRKSFVEEFGFSTQQLTLNTSPEEIFPKTNRRQIYSNFANRINLKLPPLILTKPWKILLSGFGWITIIGGLTTALLLIFISNHSNWMLLLPVAAILLTLLLSELLNPKRIAIKEVTIKEFTQSALLLNLTSLIANEGTNRREMETIINQIIAEMGGLDIEEVSPDKKIGDDLEID